MAGLATRTAALSLLLHERLCLCPRLGASLLARLGWILRGRLRARARTRARLLLQTLHPRLQARDLTLVARAQLEQKLNARLPPRPIDRLRLRPIHAALFAPAAAVPSDLQTVNPLLRRRPAEPSSHNGRQVSQDN